MAKNAQQPGLLKGKNVIGLKVVTLNKGKNIHDVDEIVYDPHDHQVKALVVDEGGWFSDASVLLFEDIQSIGKDAIVIDSDELVKKASDVHERINRIASDDTYLTDTRIMTEDGTELGKVSDIYFDAETGQVQELEVSQGIRNLQSGKKRVRVADIIKIGEDATIVRGYVEEQLEEQARHQGVSGAVTTARDKTPGFIDQAKEKLSELGTKAQEKAQELKSSTEATVTEKKGQWDENKRQEAVGKYVMVNILDQNDAMLATRGDLITNQLLLEAEQAGVLDQVLKNVSDEPVVDAESDRQREQFRSETVIYDDQA